MEEMSVEGAEKPQTAEDMLVEVLDHILETAETGIPVIMKDIRQEAFKNEAQRQYLPQIVKVTVMIETGFQLFAKHLRASDMDKLRSIQTLFFAIHQYTDVLKLTADIDATESEAISKIVDQTIDDVASHLKQFLRPSLNNPERIGFIKELAAAFCLFLDCANSMGGAQLLITPTPDQYAKMMGVPQVCPIHPPPKQQE